MHKALFLSISALILFIDQLSKWLVTEIIIRNHFYEKSALNFIDWLKVPPKKLSYAEFEITSFYNIVMVWNYGVSFGMFNVPSHYGPLILSAVAIVIVFIMMLWLMETNNKVQGLCLALIIGGAIGNVYDRIRFGAVIDFLDFHLYGYHWPAFNFADASIVIGVVFILLHMLFFNSESDNSEPKDKTQ